MTQVEIENNLNPIRGLVMNISRALPTGAQYFTVEGVDVDKTFEERKSTILTNPKSPELIMNRGPRVITMKGHSVISQDFELDIDGSNVVVFNKGLSDESKAPIVAGGATFGQTTDDAMKDAIRGELRVFADGIKTATKANQLNQKELDRWMAEKARIDRYCDSIRSAIASNTKKAEDYKAAIAKFKPEVELAGEAPIHVTIEDE